MDINITEQELFLITKGLEIVDQQVGHLKEVSPVMDSLFLKLTNAVTGKNFTSAEEAGAFLFSS